MRKRYLLSALLSTILAVAPPVYAIEPNNPNLRATEQKLENRISESTEEKLETREDYLNELKQILGPKYEAVKKDSYLKKRWSRNWENAPAKRLKAVVNLYNPELNPVPPKEILDKRFEEISGLNFFLTLNYFFWMDYGKNGEKLTPIEKAIFIQYDRDLKELHKYRTSK